MKRVLAIVLTVIILAGVNCSAYAALPVDFSPQWTNISTIVSTLTFSGVNGSAGGAVDAMSGATKVEGTLTVYRRSGNSWVYVDSDSDSTTTKSYVALAVTFDGLSGTEYKSVFEVAVTRNGVTETATKYNYEICP